MLLWVKRKIIRSSILTQTIGMKICYGVDLAESIRNAELEGIDLSQITLFYTGLTKTEKDELLRRKLLVEDTKARTIAKLDSEGLELFPDKVTEIYYLGA